MANSISTKQCKFLRSYCGKLGTFKKGKTYAIPSNVAKLLAKDIEIVKETSKVSE
jgi:hypothetical protein